MIKLFITSSFIFLFLIGKAQPYIDLLSTNFQGTTTTFKDSVKSTNRNDNYVVNLMLPIVLDSQNTIIVRAFGEKITSTLQNEKVSLSHDLFATMMPLGFQHETKNKRWKALFLAIPKFASDFRDNVSGYDFQLGGMGLLTFNYSKNLKLKAGLFYNREFFGNFFVPIISADWKASERFQIYGTFPTFLKAEYALIKKQLFTGISYRSYARSFRLSQEFSRDYVRMDDMSIKLFVDYYFKKRVVLFAEVGQTIAYGLIAYSYGTKENSNRTVLYSSVNLPLLVNFGLAYRLRFDFDK